MSMVRGIEGRNIFQDEEDRKAFVDRMRNLVEETGTRILAWALMDNHIHLLIISGPAGLSTFMRRLLTGYAYTLIENMEDSDIYFRIGISRSFVIWTHYFLELVRYIHLNPLRAGLVKDLEELEEYPWCGHGILTGKQKNDWQEKDFVLGFFGSKGKKAARALTGNSWRLVKGLAKGRSWWVVD